MIEFLLLLLLVFFPFGNLFRIPLNNGITVLPNDFILAGLFVVFIYNVLKKRTIHNTSLFKAIGIFLMVAALSLLLRIQDIPFKDFIVSLGYFIRFILYLQLLFVFQFVHKNFIKKYIQYMYVICVVIIIVGLLQYFFYSDLRPFVYLGWDEHYLRLFGTFLDPNFTGALLVLFLLFTLGYSQSKGAMKAEQFVIIASTLLAIFLTYSRSSYIMLLLSSTTYFLLSQQIKKIGVFFIIAITIFIIIPKNLPSEGVNLLRTASINARQDEYKKALVIIKDNPLLGVGFNTLRYTRVRYGFSEPQDAAGSLSTGGFPNSLLVVAATSGIIGLLGYLNIWRLIILQTFRQKAYIRALILASIIGLFTHALFENTLFYPFVMMWIFLLIGVFGKHANDLGL